MELLFLLLFLSFTIFIFIFSKKDILSPSFIYSFVFSISFFVCTINLEKWNTNLKLQTIFSIFLSIFIFFIVCFFVKPSINNYYSNSKIKFLKYNKGISILFLVFQIIISINIMYYVILITDPYGTDGSLSSAISMYQYLDKFTTLDLKFPNFLLYSYIMVYSSGYVFGFIFVYNIIFEKKVHNIILLNFIVSFISGFLTGSRGNSLQMLISIIIIYLIMYKIKHGKFKLSIIFKSLFVVFIIISSFKIIAIIMGRDGTLSTLEYLSIYIGAPIKNLDIYFENYISYLSTTKNYLSDTFLIQEDWIQKKLDINYQVRTINTDFNYINGYNLGNVYTALKNYYDDFGYLGIILFTSIKAVIIQYLYVNSKQYYDNIMYMIIFSYLYFSFALSFFSNKFYESFTVTFIQKMIFCFILIKLINIRGDYDN